MRVRQEDDEEEEEMATGWAAWKERKERRHGKSFLEKVIQLMNQMKVMRIACVVLGAVLLIYIYQVRKLKEEILENNRIADTLLLAEANTFQKCYPSVSSDISLVENKDVMLFERMLMHYSTPYADTDCQLKRYGRKKDGGYLLCKNIISHSSTLLNFGISDDDSFGCDLASNHNIKNMQFDCTLNSSYFCIGAKLLLEKVCLGDSNEMRSGLKYSTYDKIIQDYRLAEERLIVKIDIEGAEWSALHRMSNAMLDQIDQLVVELHLGSVKSSRASWQYLIAIKRLLTKFIPVNLHMNNFGCFGIFKHQHYLGSASMQVTFVNRRLISLHTFSRSFSQYNENFPNQPYYYDCQMK